MSHIHELFSSILTVEEDCLGKETSVVEMLELVSTVSSILQVSCLVLQFLCYVFMFLCDCDL